MKFYLTNSHIKKYTIHRCSYHLNLIIYNIKDKKILFRFIYHKMIVNNNNYFDLYVRTDLVIYVKVIDFSSRARGES